MIKTSIKTLNPGLLQQAAAGIFLYPENRRIIIKNAEKDADSGKIPALLYQESGIMETEKEKIKNKEGCLCSMKSQKPFRFWMRRVI